MVLCYFFLLSSKITTNTTHQRRGTLSRGKRKEPGVFLVSNKCCVCVCFFREFLFFSFAQRLFSGNDRLRECASERILFYFFTFSWPPPIYVLIVWTDEKYCLPRFLLLPLSLFGLSNCCFDIESCVPAQYTNRCVSLLCCVNWLATVFKQ